MEKRAGVGMRVTASVFGISFGVLKCLKIKSWVAIQLH